MGDGKEDIDQEGKMKSEEENEDKISVSSLLDLFQLFLVRWEMRDDQLTMSYSVSQLTISSYKNRILKMVDQIKMMMISSSHLPPSFHLPCHLTISSPTLDNFKKREMIS